MNGNNDIDYQHVFVLLFIIVLLSYITGAMYANYVKAYLSTLVVDEYTYLYVLMPSAILVTVYIIYRYFELKPPTLDRLLVFITLFLGSLLFYAVSYVRNEYMVQYGGISYIFLLLSFIILLYKPVHIKYYAFLTVLLLLIIPIPISLISYVSASLSYLMGRIMALVPGVDYIESHNRVYLGMIDAIGKYRRFEISYACSGFVSLTSVLSIFPIISYIVVTTISDLRSKIVKSLVIILASASIALIGNIIRLLLIVIITKNYGYDLAMEFFHQSPSVIYVAAAVITAFYLLKKFFPIRVREKPVRYKMSYSSKNLIAFTLIMLIAVSQLYIYMGGVLVGEVLVRYTPYIPSLKIFLQNPATIVFNQTSVTVKKSIPVPSLTPLLGASIVQEIIIYYKNKYYMGYVEVAETPTRFHGWHVCLTFQNYNILRSWSVSENITINYLLIERNNRIMLLAYTIYRLPLSIGNKTTTTYVRISLFAPASERVRNREATILAEMLTAPVKNSNEAPTEYTGETYHLFEIVVLVENILVVTSLILFIIITFKEYVLERILYWRITRV